MYRSKSIKYGPPDKMMLLLPSNIFQAVSSGNRSVVISTDTLEMGQLIDGIIVGVDVIVDVIVEGSNDGLKEGI